MDYQNEKSSLVKKNFDRVKGENLNIKLSTGSLKDMSLEDRRKEAQKPLFLTRYE
jgi:hypothetical protein